MKPFLLVSTRPEEEALDSEYQAYKKAAKLSPEDLELAEFDLLGLPPLDFQDYSGVFVAGSPYGAAPGTGHLSQREQSVREQLTTLLKEVLEADVPLLVTGNAMNILTQILGGEVAADDPGLSEITDIELTRKALEDPLVGDSPEVFPAFVNHSELVVEVPQGAVRLARSLNSPVEIYRVGDRTYAVKFNPELDAEAIRTQAQAHADAGYSGMADLEASVVIGRHGSGDHAAARILSNFAEHFRQ